MAGDFFTCWRCGWHPNLKVVQFFSGVGWEKAKELLRDYQTHHGLTKKKKSKGIRKGTLKLPTGCGELKAPYRRYLRGRRYDPDVLMEEWDLMSPGPVGGYKRRIIAPIYFNDRLVSYQGRDITEKSGLKYKACKQDDELIDHKNILY
ncbi:MAG: hypothetical protein GY757_22495 [bacterium]|nr:hypothetical protein [bacterium]